MAVVADSKYKRLLEVLSPDEAEQVLRFVSTAGPDTTLALSPDGSRPHRTQVCVTTPPPPRSRPYRTQVCVTTPPPPRS